MQPHQVRQFSVLMSAHLYEEGCVKLQDSQPQLAHKLHVLGTVLSKGQGYHESYFLALQKLFLKQRCSHLSTAQSALSVGKDCMMSSLNLFKKQSFHTGSSLSMLLVMWAGCFLKYRPNSKSRIVFKLGLSRCIQIHVFRIKLEMIAVLRYANSEAVRGGAQT